ncbi:subtilisin-like serine-protease S [Arachis hypogaea]|uniref:subtilisin-like serine-protease S n=1 Tax=Arachis hypogaea TaxID=3818 RepID=UPI003B223DAA
MGCSKVFSFILVLLIEYTLVNGSTPKEHYDISVTFISKRTAIPTNDEYEILNYKYRFSGQNDHYIVYMGDQSHPNSESVIRANHEMLASVTGSSLGEAKAEALHHYSKSFRGFSAMLTPEQANQLQEHESVVSVFESKLNRLHTTHSWDFLGLNSAYTGSHVALDWASDVIVGVVDSGVWPESESFRDYGLGPVPERFKGECVTEYTLFHNTWEVSNSCHLIWSLDIFRKIIGARFYSKGFEADVGPLEDVVNRQYFRSPRDSDGHGSHTASTIAGSIVANASLLGIGRGTARGGAANARLAIYKACWFGYCSDADILSAMDDAIHDGVDILSLSFGPSPPQPIYFEDAVSVGAFHAFQNGILVSASAGNSIFPATACNVAPWILTVAASTLDRQFRSDIHLGNSKVLKGLSLNPIKMDNWHALIYASAAAAPGVPATNASFCKNNTLDRSLIKDKIVICTIEKVTENRRLKAMVIKEGGGVGMILIDHNARDVGFEFVIPATLIGQDALEDLQSYINTERNPIARIYPTRTVLDTKPAPEVAAFSSMGPNVVTPDIIKPDITAPGVNILAAWSPVATEDTVEQRSLDYNIISGTSMSCPHISAVAAIIKSHYPSWSPASIMSAIMTTSTVMDNTGRVIGRDPNDTKTTPFDYGSGHVNPLASLNPGLVYDFNTQDVVKFLCSNGASAAQLKNLTTGGECEKDPNPTASYNFNYPSIGVSKLNGSLSVYRTVTFYGKEATVYYASIENPEGVNVTVTPSELRFMKEGEKASFRVDLKALKKSNGNFVFGGITWKNGIQRVRTPIGLNVISTSYY